MTADLQSIQFLVGHSLNSEAGYGLVSHYSSYHDTPAANFADDNSCCNLGTHIELLTRSVCVNTLISAKCGPLEGTNNHIYATDIIHDESSIY